MAVAGFNLADLSIAVNGHALTIAGRRPTTNLTTGTGSCTRASLRALSSAASSWPISSKIRGAQLENGLLHVVLRRELPRP